MRYRPDCEISAASAKSVARSCLDTWATSTTMFSANWTRSTTNRTPRQAASSRWTAGWWRISSICSHRRRVSGSISASIETASISTARRPPPGAARRAAARPRTTISRSRPASSPSSSSSSAATVSAASAVGEQALRGQHVGGAHEAEELAVAVAEAEERGAAAHADRLDADLEVAEVVLAEVEHEVEDLAGAVGQGRVALEQAEQAPLAGLDDVLLLLAALDEQRGALLLGGPAQAGQLLVVAGELAELAGDLELDAGDLWVADEDDVELDAELLVVEHDGADVDGAVEEFGD